MGMANPSDYIAYKVIKDKMFALTLEGILCCWNITTAKMLTRKTIEEANFSESYELSSKYKEGPVLLRSTATVDSQ